MVGCLFFNLSVHEITLTDAGYHVNANGQLLDEAYALYAYYGGLNGWNTDPRSLFICTSTVCGLSNLWPNLIYTLV